MLLLGCAAGWSSFREKPVGKKTRWQTQRLIFRGLTKKQFLSMGDEVRDRVPFNSVRLSPTCTHTYHRIASHDQSAKIASKAMMGQPTNPPTDHPQSGMIGCDGYIATRRMVFGPIWATIPSNELGTHCPTFPALLPARVSATILKANLDLMDVTAE